MTKQLTYACLLLLPACGGRTSGTGGTDSEGDTGTGDSTGAGSVTLTTTLTTDPSATMTTTVDPTETTVEPTTDPTVDPDTSTSAGTTGGGGSSCCAVHDTPGCDDDAVSLCVCEQAAECCVFEWADNCVALAMGDCAADCDPGGSSSSGGSNACGDIVQIDLAAADATLEGDWALAMSMLGEGEIIAIPQGTPNPEGTVTWDVDVPCDDDWYIWVRALDFGDADSYFARQDGGPEPAPIFEAGCDFMGQGYVWRVLNWRDPVDGMSCEYVEDPWIAPWATGVHQFQLEYRESSAVARIIVTNDEAFVPM